jgi:metallo-beta-lactamase family protein
VREVSPGLAVPIADTSFVVRFLPVAHVLGSCAIHLTDVDNDQTLLYTGDLGPIANPQATLPQYALSEMLAADLVVMESTYGSQPHEFTDGRVRRRQLSMRESDLKQLCERATRAAERGGCMLLPAFSLGRTQELAMLIEQARRDGEAPSGEIIVAGMGERITQVYEAYSKGTNAWARAQDMPRVDELGGRVRKTGKPFAEAAAEALDGDFSYIIASPAMLGSGWSRTFLEQMVENPAHAIVMSGFVPRHGGGIPGLHRMHTGATMELSGRSVRVQASFDQLKGLSAHAPAVDLRKFAAYMARQSHSAAFAMVHGEEAAQRALAEDVGALPEVALAESLHNSQVWQPRRP